MKPFAKTLCAPAGKRCCRTGRSKIVKLQKSRMSSYAALFKNFIILAGFFQLLPAFPARIPALQDSRLPETVPEKSGKAAPSRENPEPQKQKKRKPKTTKT